MPRKRKGEIVNGWINLDKPAGMTSTQAVGRVRRIYNAQKAGHAGTLDPLATGILPIALGEATKTIPFIQDALKTYAFTVKWGQSTDTDDAEGKVIATSEMRPTMPEIEKFLPAYTGEITQIPPRFSAIKIDGQRAYDLARAGEEIEMKPRQVYIEKLEILESRKDEADFCMTCGKGTYVRSLARDLAVDLGTYGHITALRRERVGPFSLKNAILLDNLEQTGNSAARNQALLPLESALDDIPALPLREDESARLKNGQTIRLIARPDLERLHKAGLDTGGGIQTALARNGEKSVALVEVSGVEIRPVRILHL